MDKGFKGRIINAIRKLSFSYAPRNNAKNRMKVGPSTFQCEDCGVWIYEGSRDLSKQLEILDITPPNGILKGKANMDHKEPVVPLEGFSRGSWDWHEFIERMFCDENGFSALCKGCHDIKTELEDEMRKDYRLNKKLVKK
jgi:hypothetical protein